MSEQGDSWKRWTRGLRRFAKIVLGVGSGNSNEIAGNYVLLVGFVIEYWIIRAAVTSKFQTPNPDMRAAVGYGLTLLLVPLFFHQFMIFRNFALPPGGGPKDEKKKVSEESDKLREKLEQLVRDTPSETQDEVLAEIERIKAAKISEEKAAEKAQAGKDEKALTWVWSRRKRAVEIVIYFLFAILTGEAGYMLTLARAHNENFDSLGVVQCVQRNLADPQWSAESGPADRVRSLRSDIVQGPERFSTAKPSEAEVKKMINSSVQQDRKRWGTTLEGVFIFTASIVCILVLLWDIIVLATATERSQYERLIGQFMLNDSLSLIVWACVLLIVTPLSVSAVDWAWLFLALSYAGYLAATIVRIKRGFIEIGTPDTYEAARFIKI